MIQFGKPDISEEEERAILRVLRSGWLGNGPIAEEFERAFAAHLGVYHCVAVNSATMGLMLSLLACDLGKHKQIATTPLTFAATVNAILNVGAQPYFSDVDDNGNLDPDEICAAAIHAVLPVHYTGTPCRMKEIFKLGKPVIEDAAHGFGGTYQGQPLGTLGKCGIFSFYPTKNITTGDGGMVVCQDEDTANQIRLLANQGQSHNAWSRYGAKRTRNGAIIEVGYKGAMPDLNASLGLAQLHRWPEIQQKRDKIWRIYEKAFGKRPKGHSHHLFTIQRKDRDKVRERLKKQGIPTGIHYDALHLEPAYKFLGYHKGDFPNAERIAAQTLSLPISGTMTEEEAHQVVNAL